MSLATTLIDCPGSDEELQDFPLYFDERSNGDSLEKDEETAQEVPVEKQPKSDSGDSLKKNEDNRNRGKGLLYPVVLQNEDNAQEVSVEKQPKSDRLVSKRKQQSTQKRFDLRNSCVLCGDSLNQNEEHVVYCSRKACRR